MSIKKSKEWGADVFPFLSWFKTDKVQNAKVLVAGAGALGNEALKNLALFGVGNIIIVDFDKIEYSNLTRSILFRPEDADRGFYKAEIAAKRINEINPDVNVYAICGDLATDVGLGLYRRMNVLLGCLDNLWARVTLNKLSFRAGVPWIDGGIGDMEGEVNGYQLNKNCYECSLTDDELKELKETRMSCAGVTREHEKRGRVATTPVSASIIAAIQVQEAMKMIHKDDNENGLFTPLIGTMFRYEGMHPYADVFECTTYKEECVAHEQWDNIIEIASLSADMTVAKSLSVIKEALQVENVEINMRNNRFIAKLETRSDRKTFSPMLPESMISDYIKASDELETYSFMEGGLYQHAFENINEEFPYPHLTLKQIGIPCFDVLQVTTEKGYAFVELSADREYYKEALEL